jgi:hypothetical protein
MRRSGGAAIRLRIRSPQRRATVKVAQAGTPSHRSICRIVEMRMRS